MIATISPSALNYEETLSTLRYVTTRAFMCPAAACTYLPAELGWGDCASPHMPTAPRTLSTRPSSTKTPTPASSAVRVAPSPHAPRHTCCLCSPPTPRGPHSSLGECAIELREEIGRLQTLLQQQQGGGGGGGGGAGASGGSGGMSEQEQAKENQRLREQLEESYALENAPRVTRPASHATLPPRPHTRERLKAELSLSWEEKQRITQELQQLQQQQLLQAQQQQQQLQQAQQQVEIRALSKLSTHRGDAGL